MYGTQLLQPDDFVYRRIVSLLDAVAVLALRTHSD